VKRAVAPDGREWIVRRRLAPRLAPETLWARFRHRVGAPMRHLSTIGDVADAGCVVEAFDDLAVAFLVALGVLLAVLVVIPLLVALLDVLVIVLLGALGVLARVGFRRPWTVEACPVDGAGIPRQWRVVGWRDAGRMVEEVAESVRRGQPILPPPPYV
jgi:hypothetical protein